MCVYIKNVANMNAAASGNKCAYIAAKHTAQQDLNHTQW